MVAQAITQSPCPFRLFESFCARFGEPWPRPSQRKLQEVGQKCRRLLGRGKRFVLDAGFHQRHGFPDTRLRKSLPPAPSPGRTAGGRLLPRCHCPWHPAQPRKARQKASMMAVNNDLLLGSVRAVAKLQHKWRHKAQIFLLGNRPENWTGSPER